MSEQESRAEGTVVDHAPEWVDVIDWIIDDIKRGGNTKDCKRTLKKCAELADKYNAVAKSLGSMFTCKRCDGTGYADTEGFVEGAVCPDCVGEGVCAPEITAAPDASLLEKNREYKEFLDRLLNANKKEDE